MAFDAKKVYAKGVAEYDTASKKAQQKKDILSTLYHDAVSQLGYTEVSLKNNEDKQKEVAKKMFELAGTAKNTLLTQSPFYQGFSKASEAEKQQMHQEALGMSYDSLLRYVDQFGGSLDSRTFNTITDRIILDQSVDAVLTNYLSLNSGTKLEEKKKNLAALAALDSNIRVLNPNFLDMDTLMTMARESIKGTYGRRDLEDRVGVEAPKYKWQAEGVRNAA